MRVHFTVLSIISLSLGKMLQARVVPENNVSIPVESISTSGLSLEDANRINVTFFKIYKTSFQKYGAKLKFVVDWHNPRVNAFADRSFDNWRVTLLGGLIRHPKMTTNALKLVICHELGHHIGGAPKKELLYASAEGQADYWATQNCFKKSLLFSMKYSELKETATALESKIHERSSKKCRSIYRKVQDRDLCIISLAAAIEISDFLNSLRKRPQDISLGRPDISRVDKTNLDYPRTLQCRLDTFVAGALCPKTTPPHIDQRNELDSGCMEQGGFKVGHRPSCWYKPFTVYPHLR